MNVNSINFYGQFIRNLSSSNQAIDRAVRGILDQKRVRVASDDPAAARASLDFRARWSRLESYNRSAEAAKSDLGAMESALQEIYNRLIVVSSKASEALSSTNEPALDTLAGVIDSERATIRSLANTSSAGRYLFSGTETLTEPFNDTGAYFGNNNETTVSIADGISVGSTVSGKRVFINAGDVLGTLDDLATAMRTNDTAAMTALHAQVEAQMDHINQIHAEIGTRVAQSISTVDRNRDEIVSVQSRIGELEGLPLDRAIVELTAANNSYEAISSTAARVLGRSLFDYLG